MFSQIIRPRLHRGFRIYRRSLLKRIQSTEDSISCRYLGDDSDRPDNEGSRRRIAKVLFEMFRESETEMSIYALQNKLAEYGMKWKSDPRFESAAKEILQWREDRREAKESTSLCSEEDLIRLMGDQKCISLLAKVLSRQCIIPNFERFHEKIQGIYDTVKNDESGQDSSLLATYIPQLAVEDPTKFGVALCTTDGQRIEIGDADSPFCLQSCVKPFQYAIAVSNHTSRFVHSHIGKEPSGHLFNAIMLNSEEQPHNPMINAGALVVCSLIKPEVPVADRYVHVQSLISEMAANEYTSFNNAVFQSEKATSYRNFALAYLLKEKNCFTHDASLEETVDLYLQLCALKMTCSSACVAASTLANGGVCPLFPEKRVLNPVAVRNTLSLMHSCGMYDYSGVFAFHVGLPAKSGVAGGLMLVVPNVMGIMIWSPLLDERGNSVRGLRFCKELVRQFNFHTYDNLRFSERKSDPRLSRTPLNELEERLLMESMKLCDGDTECPESTYNTLLL